MNPPTADNSLHAFLLLDTSASMDGAPLEALKQGLRLLCGTFISRSKRPIQISLISYESAAREIMPLRDVTEFEMPDLEAVGSSGLGGALRIVASRLGGPAHDPSLVYVFTDGDPTDDWEVAIEPLRENLRGVIGIGCGIAANLTALAEIADRAFTMRELTPDLLYETFRAYM